jgi:Macrocin-O-methyltransferase (TylF)
MRRSSRCSGIWGWREFATTPASLPATTRGHKSALARFAFVHLDVDIYQSTLDAPRFFYPRLSPSGMIVTHDYSAQICPAVATAYDEFFADKPERVLPVWDSQAVVVNLNYWALTASPPAPSSQSSVLSMPVPLRRRR